MSSSGEAQSLPTMVIPRGTEIRTDGKGLVSIRTPGNLILQNSGSYGEIESTGGSIRIDENVQIEAVSIRAAEGCFIQGTLTAWRLQAKRIALDHRARAFVMLQESERLDIASTARLVGNFADEQEVYLMLGKFAGQLKQLPGTLELGGRLAPAPAAPAIAAAASEPPPAPRSVTAPPEGEISGNLRQALGILEREIRRPDLDAGDGMVLRDLTAALRAGDAARTARIYRDSFTDLRNPSESMRLAFTLIDADL
ncbi:MAG: hypothetical protein LC732_00130, partial [Acidobacteria bacterium]|nr:hypothetical protein [Acidobacteriota bacterium]